MTPTPDPQQQQPEVPDGQRPTLVELLRVEWQELKNAMRANDKRRGSVAMQSIDLLLGVDKFGNIRPSPSEDEIKRMRAEIDL